MRRLSTADADFAAGFERLLAEARETTERVDAVVAGIIADIRARGDAALIDCTARFDRLRLTQARLRVTETEIDAAVSGIAPALRDALDLAARRIEAFHAAQMPADLRIDDPAGLTLGMRWTALDAVGLYVPGGKAAYPSSVLMNALPGRVAGVERVAMC
ncbi:MAG: histidinol dehydrogenase, partial [Acetobacteraceae bacterium]